MDSSKCILFVCVFSLMLHNLAAQHKHDVDMPMPMPDHNMTMGMKNYFHFSTDETVLFESWHITTTGGMIGSVVGIFLLSMLYEGLKYFREHLFRKQVSSIQFSTVNIAGDSASQVHKIEKHKMLSLDHTLQTTLHVVQIVASYFLMLIFMTFNVWLCLAVVAGTGVGYFIFGWKKATVVDITEHCR